MATAMKTDTRKYRVYKTIPEGSVVVDANPKQPTRRLIFMGGAAPLIVDAKQADKCRLHSDVLTIQRIEEDEADEEATDTEK